jgi:hypothetical protein
MKPKDRIAAYQYVADRVEVGFRQSFMCLNLPDGMEGDCPDELTELFFLNHKNTISLVGGSRPAKFIRG